MKQDSTDSPVSKPTQPTQLMDTQAELGNPDHFGEADNPVRPLETRREPTILTLQDLIDLPRQVLPEETYIHLRNAAREAGLAAFTLWRSIDKARKSGDKVRTHIDVE